MLAAALTGGLLCQPGPSYASDVLTAGPATALAAPAAPGTCPPGQVSAVDQAIAEGLRPSMTGRRLGRLVSGRHIACARVIIGHVRDRGLGQRAATIAVTTAIAESTLNNRTVATDHDSLGLFQQRPSQGWGTPQQLVDPGYATRKFLDAMIRKHPGDSWMTGDIGAICQRVQGSAYPLAYAPEARDAQLLVATLWTSAGGGAAPAAAPAGPQPTASATPSAPAPAGPFQRTLSAGGIELGPLTGRHGSALADWNGDGRTDLIVVKGTATVTGKTELRIMDGASNFSALLLTTATALGPTDERHAYAMADWSGDGWPDLMVVQKSGTATGRTQLTVVDGATSFQTVLLDTATALAPTGAGHRFAVADWNGDGRLDLVTVQTSGTASRKVEVQVLDGASQFQRLLGPAVVTAEPAHDKIDVSLADWNNDRRPDLVILQKSGTASGKTELRVLDAASQLRRHLLRARTGYAATDDRHDLLIHDGNGDGRLDLTVAQKFGTASGRTEVTTLGG